MIQSISSEDCIFEYKLKGKLKKIRVIKIKRSDDITEILVTNIYDKTISHSQFKELYFLRWGVECKYKDKNLKSEYQANRNFILSEVLKKIIAIMVKPIAAKRILENILEKAKNKHPRKNHHSQRKSCI